MYHFWHNRSTEALNLHFQKELFHQVLTQDRCFDVLIIIILILDWNTLNQVPQCALDSSCCYDC